MWSEQVLVIKLQWVRFHLCFVLWIGKAINVESVWESPCIKQCTSIQEAAKDSSWCNDLLSTCSCPSASWHEGWINQVSIPKQYNFNIYRSLGTPVHQLCHVNNDYRSKCLNNSPVLHQRETDSDNTKQAKIEYRGEQEFPVKIIEDSRCHCTIIIWKSRNHFSIL